MFLFLINHCDFDKYLSHYKPVIATPINRTKRSLTSGSQKIRIVMDYEFLGSGTDNYECNYEGQVVTWSSANNFVCTKDDVLSLQKINAIKGTMNNVKKYLESIFSVDPVTYSFKLYRPDYFYSPAKVKTVSNVDLHLTVTSRPMDSTSTLASAGPLKQDPDTLRPIQGGVYINPRNAPTEVQDENSWNCNFFYTCVHEIFHAMGVTNQLYEIYHPRHDNTPHSQILCDLNDYGTGKKHKILVTPYAHKFAVQQWGTEEFRVGSQSCPSGIPIEDGGGQGTAGSHPEGRISTTDLMGGVSYQTENGPYNRFTPLTMAILLDTGFYDIDYRKIQPLMWGNKDTTEDGQYITDFVTGPPEHVFPQQYIYRPGRDPDFDGCGFNFKTIGGLNKFSLSAQGSNWDCSNPSATRYSNVKAYCDAKRFYNANNNDEIGGDWPNDFQIFHFPSEVCSKGEACIAGARKCLDYTIAPDERSFTVKLLQRTPNEYFDYECNEGNVGVNYTYKEYDGHSGYYYPRVVQCPPIKQFIRSVRMYEDMPFLTEDPFTGDSKPVPPAPKPRTQTPKPKPRTQTPKPKPRTQTPKPKPVTPEPTPTELHYLNLENPTDHTFIITYGSQTFTLGGYRRISLHLSKAFVVQITLKNQYCEESTYVSSRQSLEYRVISESDIPEHCLPGSNADQGDLIQTAETKGKSLSTTAIVIIAAVVIVACALIVLGVYKFVTRQKLEEYEPEENALNGTLLV